MTAVDSLAGPRVELARYLTSDDGERVIYAARVGGIVVVSDWPAAGAGRAFVIERGVTCERELYALVTDYPPGRRRLLMALSRRRARGLAHHQRGAPRAQLRPSGRPAGSLPRRP